MCTIIAALCSLYVPWLVRDMIDTVLAGKDEQSLHFICISILWVFGIRLFFFYNQSYLMAYAGQNVIADLRADVFRHFQQLSLSFYEKRKTGEIMSYITNDVSALQTVLVENIIEMITESFVLFISIGAMIYLDWKLTLFTFSTFPVVVLVIDFLGRKIKRSGAQIQERFADITSVLQETITSARVIKSFVRENYEMKRFEQKNVHNLQAGIKNSKELAALTPTIEFIAALGVTAIMWFGGREVINDEITAGSLIAFLMYAVNIANPIKRITRVYGNIQKAMAAAERVFAVLDIKSEVVDSAQACEVPHIKGQVTFENIEFSYDGTQKVINDFSFVGNPGQMIAIVGSSGAGKSTITNLLPRFYDVSAGAIYIDGCNIKNIKLTSLREQIGIVPQETTLFNGTVYDNILYGRLDASESDVHAAASAANADAFIRQLPQGYETMLGDRGLNLSGGQRQRIAIARAILKNPRILILDEATSALDTQSEQLVQEALDRLMQGRTSFVIAHRLSTIQRADVILVMDKGRLVERGSHEELLAQGGIYAQLHKVQDEQTVTE